MLIDCFLYWQINDDDDDYDDDDHDDLFFAVVGLSRSISISVIIMITIRENNDDKLNIKCALLRKWNKNNERILCAILSPAICR